VSPVLVGLRAGASPLLEEADEEFRPSEIFGGPAITGDLQAIYKETAESFFAVSASD
jgi:hypothetical protein